MGTEPHRILLLEDEPSTLERLRRAVEDHPALSVCGQAMSCRDGEALIRSGEYDVLLSDLGFPDGNGIHLIRLSRQLHPQAEIMVITVFADERHVLTAIEAGASGYLLKDGDSSYIGESILQLLAGGSPISASIARHLLQRLKPEAPQPNPDAPPMTPREQQVLELVAKGFSYAEIATTLNISVNTVTSHIKQIYRKLSVNSRGEAVFEASQMGLIRPL